MKMNGMRGRHAMHHMGSIAQGGKSRTTRDGLSRGEKKMLRSELQPGITKKDRHAFIMVGSNTLFLCHMTMFHMEGHCYQLILRAKLPEAAMRRFRAWRKQDPEQAYFLANLPGDLMTVPEIKAGARRYFQAEIFKGIPKRKVYDHWPWNGLKPEIANVRVTVESVVYYRHFDFNLEHPASLAYVLFGDGNEAHMQSYQTKEPDFDHVLSLREAPGWLPKVKLEAGVHVNFPKLRRRPVSRNPLRDKTYDVEYQGFWKYLGYKFSKRHPISVGTTWWFSTSPLNMRPPG